MIWRLTHWECMNQAPLMIHACRAIYSVMLLMMEHKNVELISTEHDSHGEAPLRHTAEREDMETTEHTDEMVSKIKCQLNR